MDGEQEAAQALDEALQAARAALGRVAGWCEVVDRDAARRRGPGAVQWRTDGPYVQALGVRGRVADVVRKLELAAEEFGQARDSARG